MRSFGSRTATVLAGAVALALTLAAPAGADFGITSFNGSMLNRDGSSALQAGAHPYALTMSFQLTSAGLLSPDGQVKDVRVDLPTGVVGNPLITPTNCTNEQLTDPAGLPLCPVSSQLGTATIYFAGPGVNIPISTLPIYDMVAPPGEIARFGFVVLGHPVFMVPRVRTGGDYGLSVDSRDISQAFPIAGVSVTFWGVPADPAHDADRGTTRDAGIVGADDYCANLDDPACSNVPGYQPKAFLTNRVDCWTGPQRTTLSVASWQDPGVFQRASYDHDTNDSPMAVAGCEKVPFEPSVDVRPTNTRPDAPTGLDVSVSFPTDGFENPAGVTQAALRTAAVALPEGMTVSPAAADGLGACAPGDVRLQDASSPSCPENSKIGTVDIDTPLVETPLSGPVYLAKQNDNPFGSLLALYLVAKSSSMVVKLAGKVDPDPSTGRLITTFDNTPQLPFTRLTVRLKSGPRAPLANPPTCGPKVSSVRLRPWTGTASVVAKDSFTIDCPGMFGFAPAFEAGVASPLGGSFSPFLLQIDRPDGQEFLGDLDLILPGGLLARIKDVPLCGSADAAAGTCPGGSRIGTATVSAGAGSAPFSLTGTLSLTEGYQGAPYGLVLAVRVLAGPLDLGTAIVRAAVSVDPADGHIVVTSDPLPSILQGIPLRLRSLHVDVDRPRFMTTPTSCAAKSVAATLRSQQGSASRVRAPFRVGGCRALPLSPRVTMTLTGRRQVGNGRHPGLKVVLTQAIGEANVKRLAARLPLSLALDPANADALCSYAGGRASRCPANSIVGRATAVSPLMNEPLSGPVYLVKGTRTDRRTGRRIRTLPTLLIPLHGEIALDLRARTAVRDGKLTATFAGMPDAALSRVSLSLQGGRQGVLVVTGKRGLCKGKQVSRLLIDGQNGRRADRSVRMKTPCGTGTSPRRKR